MGAYFARRAISSESGRQPDPQKNDQGRDDIERRDQRPADDLPCGSESSHTHSDDGAACSAKRV